MRNRQYSHFNNAYLSSVGTSSRKWMENGFPVNREYVARKQKINVKDVFQFIDKIYKRDL